jgi:hypothetical protein
MSSYLDHQQLQEKEPKQSHYTEVTGTRLNIVASQNNLTLGLYDLTYTNSTEKVSRQMANKTPNPQMKNQLDLKPNQKTPVKRSSHSTMHHQLKQQS